jgi:hypothetical protein
MRRRLRLAAPRVVCRHQAALRKIIFMTTQQNQTQPDPKQQGAENTKTPQQSQSPGHDGKPADQKKSDQK